MTPKKAEQQTWNQFLDNTHKHEVLSSYSKDIHTLWRVLSERIPNLTPPQVGKIWDNGEKGFVFRWSTIILYAEVEYFSPNKLDCFFRNRVTNAYGGGEMTLENIQVDWLNAMIQEFSKY